MPANTTDDVIRIRVDTARAVRGFLDLLAAQAAEGETRAPAKPRATALYRELAPYRLVEYAYVDDGVGAVEGAYIGLPDGTVLSATDEIPEEVVDALVAGEVAGLPPVYVYVVLERAAEARAIDRFLAELSGHVGLPLVGVFHDDGSMRARGYPGDDPTAIAPDVLATAVARAECETAHHLTKQQVLTGFAARSESADGRAFARVAFGFAKHVMEFTSAGDRDDFVAWSRRLCDVLEAQDIAWEALGFRDLFRPAEPASAPRAGIVSTPVPAPRQVQGGRPWRAFDGDRLVDREVAGDYWRLVIDAVAAGEAGAEQMDGWMVRG